MRHTAYSTTHGSSKHLCAGEVCRHIIQILTPRWPCFGLLLWTAILPAWAQNTPVTLSYGNIEGFELYGVGYFRWVQRITPEENLGNSRHGTITIRELRGSGVGGQIHRNGGPVYDSYDFRVGAGANPLAGEGSVARAGEDLFLWADAGGSLRLYRRQVYGEATADAGNDFSGVSYGTPGAMAVGLGRVFWSCAGGAASGGGEVRSKPADSLPGGGDVIEFGGLGVARKMLFTPILNSDGTIYRHALILLNTAGQVWRLHVYPTGQTPPTRDLPVLITANATDIALRQELALGGVGFGEVHRTRLYVTSGFDMSETRPSGKLSAYNLTAGGSSVIFDTSSADIQLTAVAVDNEQLFITRTPVETTGGPFGNSRLVLENSQIHRKGSRADTTVFGGGFGPANFQALVLLEEGRNLRSDGELVYWLHQGAIRRIRSDAPPPQFNLASVGIEAVQAVQDFNNSVPLITGKATTVRAYAWETTNTTGKTGFPMRGRLRGFLNNLALSPPEIFAASALVDGNNGLATLRSNWNRSFNFDLPTSWCEQPGSLRLEFTVNSTLAAPETDAAPFADNTSVATLNVMFIEPPRLVLRPMHVGSLYDPLHPTNGWGGILDRATSLLPTRGFKWFYRPSPIYKPVVTLTGIKDRSFDWTDDSKIALFWLAVDNFLSRNPDGFPDTHWVGLVPGSAGGTVNGIGGLAGLRASDKLPVPSFLDFDLPDTAYNLSLVARMGSMNPAGTNLWGTPLGGTTLAHELGHNYGRKHISQYIGTNSNCGGSVPDGPFDTVSGEPCFLNANTDLNNPTTPLGFDPINRVLVPPDAAADMMTYSTSRWVRASTWFSLLRISPPAKAAPSGHQPKLNPQPLPPHDPLRFFGGIYHPNTGAAALLSALEVPANALDGDKVAELLAASAAAPAGFPFQGRLRDAGGVLLDSRALSFVPAGDGDEAASVLFLHVAPLAPNAARFEVFDGTNVVAAVDRSAHVPTLSLGTPVVDEVAQSLTLGWSADDLDGDGLMFAVQFSPDAGTNWESLVTATGTNFLSADTRFLHSGAECLLRVAASDGFNTTWATTDPFTLSNHAPVVVIDGATTNQAFAFGELGKLRVVGYDAEDGSLPATSLYLSATGTEYKEVFSDELTLQGLAPGPYIISAQGIDADGHAAVIGLPVSIQPIVVPDMLAPTFDGFVLAGEYDAAPPIPLFHDNAGPVARLTHAGGALRVSLEGLPMSASEAGPASLTIYVDTTPSRATELDGGSVGFRITEDGEYNLLVPLDATNFTTAASNAGYLAQVTRGVSTWNAELLIPESLVNGWLHQAGVAFLFQRESWFALPPPLNGGVAIPDAPRVWPSSAGPSQPATWAYASFGPLTGPALEIRREADGSVTISWPASATAFSLEHAEFLGDSWLPVTDTPTPSGDRLELNIQPIAASGFWRLHR